MGIASFSIIIEWENILNAEMRRVKKLFQQLSKQLIEVSSEGFSRPEIIILYNSNEVKGSVIEQIANEQLKPCLSLIDFKIIPAPGLHYYEMKNFGAQYSDKDVVIFLDSDVIPDDGWLSGLLGSFKRQEVSLVGGNAYIAPNSLYEKGFAWLWNYHMKFEGDDEICETKRFWANNVAFRREVFNANPFPELQQYRCSCISLAAELNRKGIKMFRQPRSRVNHPTPYGIKNFFKRALVNGHDQAIGRKFRHNPVYDRQKKFVNYQRKKIIFYLQQRYKDLGLSRTDAIGAIGIVFSFIAIKYIGFMLASINPGIIRKIYPF